MKKSIALVKLMPKVEEKIPMATLPKAPVIIFDKTQANLKPSFIFF